jgi:GT2 family glycosyltransferase
MPGAKTSILVVTYYTGPVLEQCLERALGRPGAKEVVVVNNGNPPDTVRWLDELARQNPQKMKLLHTGQNLGFGKACNLAARTAEGEFIVILNPDALIDPGSIAAFEDAARPLDGLYLIGGRIYNPGGREQRGGRRLMLTPWRAAVTYFGLHLLERVGLTVFANVHRERDPAPSQPVAMPVVSGALMYMQREQFLGIGGFDEDYFLHVEDIDFCRRVHDLGGQVIYQPAAAALHYGSTSRVPMSFVDHHKAAGLSHYFVKHARNPVTRTLARGSRYGFQMLLATRRWALRGRQILNRLKTAKAPVRVSAEMPPPVPTPKPQDGRAPTRTAAPP